MYKGAKLQKCLNWVTKNTRNPKVIKTRFFEVVLNMMQLLRQFKHSYNRHIESFVLGVLINY